MLIHALSDSHNQHRKLEKQLTGGDVLIHAGDFSGQGHIWEYEDFLKWLAGFNDRYKDTLLICGNHEINIELTHMHRFKEMCAELDITYLEDSGVEIDGVKFYGSPVQPWFQDWGWNKARNESEAALYRIGLIKPHWDAIPDDTNVLITHGPPYDILDELVYVDGTPRGQFVGCQDLLTRIKELKDLDLHLFGHIHCGYGQKHQDGVSYYNVAVCDEQYWPSNPVTVIEYEK